MKHLICTRCVMDTSDPKISFNNEGVCNHCLNYDKTKKRYSFSEDKKNRIIQKIINNIKVDGKNKKYDCLIGMSGGVDSSFVAYKAIEFGLRPLAFHIDNEWDSPIAIENIKKITNKLNIPLKNITVNWDEFKDLQIAFLKSSTPDLEVPTDHAIIGIPYKVAKDEEINYIITGYNYRTETHLPSSWSSPGQPDGVYIKTIHKKFGTVPLLNYPYFTPLQYLLRNLYYPIKKVDLLNYIDYNKNEAIVLLNKEFGFNYYGGKHWESIYTRFLQTYILPIKFGYDKRRSHFSSLICSGLLSREDALKELSHPPMSKEELEKDLKIVLKKFNMTEKYFNELMKMPNKSYWDYTHSKLFDNYFFKLIMSLKILINTSFETT